MNDFIGSIWQICYRQSMVKVQRKFKINEYLARIWIASI